MRRRLALISILGVALWSLPGSLLFADSPFSRPEPRQLSFEYPVESAGQLWIQSTTEFVMVFPLPLDAVRAVIRDYQNYPRFTPRLKATEILLDDGGNARIRQHYCVELLGLRFPTMYELLISSDDSQLPLRWRQSWTLSLSDGSIGASTGEWILESISLPDGSLATRATTRNRGLVRKDFPLQVAIMRQVAEKELDKGFVAIYREAVRRAAIAGAAP